MPRRLAQPATKGALEEAQRKRERAEEAEQQAAERAGETSALLAKTVLTINHRAGEDGKLFGSVTSAEIAEAIQAARSLKVDRKKIRLEEPIRETGTYMVEIEVGGGVTAYGQDDRRRGEGVAAAKTAVPRQARIVPGIRRPQIARTSLRPRGRL